MHTFDRIYDSSVPASFLAEPQPNKRRDKLISTFSTPTVISTLRYIAHLPADYPDTGQGDSFVR
jgi:hypothetical protein